MRSANPPADPPRGKPPTNVRTLVPSPEVPEYLKQVLGLFVIAIPPDARKLSVLQDKTAFPIHKGHDDQEKFLVLFVSEKLNSIARLEYGNWLNGLMPFVSPREIQIWRLRQFAEYIWDWNLPEDDDLATIFNLTKRQATNLAGDFHAKFRKLYLYPRILRRLLDLIDGNPQRIEIRVGDALGKLYFIPSKRYVYELNVVIGELREKDARRILRAATIYERNDQLMWVSDEVVALLKDPALKQELLKLHPVGAEAHE